MAVGDLFHLNFFSFRINFPEIVCLIVRPEHVLLGETFCVDLVPAGQNSQGTTSGELSANCPSHGSGGLCQTRHTGKESQA